MGRQRMRWLDGITHSLNGHEFEQVGDGQGGLACCSLWGLKELDITEWLKNDKVGSYCITQGAHLRAL